MNSVLVTGANGFIGRHLSKDLSLDDFRVVGVGHGRPSKLLLKKWGIDHWIEGDIDQESLSSFPLELGSPSMIFHLAGGSSVAPSIADPVSDFNRSVKSTLELLEWTRRTHPSAKLVLSSSAAVYGSQHNSPISELDQLSPFSPYGYHKRMAEELFQSYGENFGLNVAIVRLFSVYGPELRKQLLWDICNKLHQDSENLILGGTGEEVRDWIHVQDATKILRLALIQAKRECPIVNGGSGHAIRVKEIATLVSTEWGTAPALNFTQRSRPGDPRYLVSQRKLYGMGGLNSYISVERGIAEYVSWFKQTQL